MAEKTLYKGELMEESLRKYFLGLGYYVVRSVVFKYENLDITDIDLWLYSRPSSISRERINVDIKNRKTPQAIERIFWTKGLNEVLGLEKCIVATMDKRPSVRTFGILNKVTVLDGNFLSKLNNNISYDRLKEEEFYSLIKNYDVYVSDWKSIYDNSKSRLISDLDFGGSISCLENISYFLEQYIVNTLKSEVILRLIYILTSHFLIIVDYLMKELAYLDLTLRSDKLIDGFRFGNLGRQGLDKTLSLAVEISGDTWKKADDIKEIYDSLPVEILRDFFVKNENVKNLFNWAKALEALAFSRKMYNFSSIPIELQSIIFMLLDYSRLERKRFISTSFN